MYQKKCAHYVDFIIIHNVHFSSFICPQKYLIYAVLWSFSGDGRLKMRAELGEYIRRITTVPLPAAPNVPIIDYEVQLLVLNSNLLLLSEF